MTTDNPERGGVEVRADVEVPDPPDTSEMGPGDTILAILQWLGDLSVEHRHTVELAWTEGYTMSTFTRTVGHPMMWALDQGATMEEVSVWTAATLADLEREESNPRNSDPASQQ